MEIKLNQLTIENVGIWPSAIKAIIVVIIFSISFILGYWFNTVTQLAHLKSLKLQQQALLQTIKIKYPQATNVKVYQKQLTQINDILKESLLKLPTHAEIPGLLNDISNIGISNGLTFVVFKPEPESKQGFYITLPIQISVIGNYHQLGKFVNGIETLKRIVTLHNFVIKPMTSEELRSISEINELHKQLLFIVTAKTYRYMKNMT